MSTDFVYMCPTCGSAAVEFSELVGGSAACKVCKWAGPREQLVGVPFQHAFGSREGIGFELHNDLRRLFSTPVFVTQLGSFLNRWGFINLGDDKSVVTRAVTRYIVTAVRAVLTALIEERVKIEEEKANG
jgi:hypothetical protein